jgi:hypothetical protein
MRHGLVVVAFLGMVASLVLMEVVRPGEGRTRRLAAMTVIVGLVVGAWMFGEIMIARL